jgi:iron complex outermembrane recepter protein
MISIRTRNLRRLATALFCSAAFAGVIADAAVAQESSEGIETVTVTARARSEDIHNVPSQVTAFTADQIEAMGIQEPADFIQAVPNVSFIETQNAGTSFLVIRGIGQARNSEPSAAIVVDGVPMTQPAQFNQAMLDIQQIEVVKGPQGALYGRNAIGGAIIVTTQQPDFDTWGGYLTAGYESGPGGKVQGVISGPVTDELAIRLQGYYFDTRGHIRNHNNTDSSAEDWADPVKNFNARFTAVWKPNEHFTADLRVSTDNLDTLALYYIIQPFTSPTFNDPNFTDQNIMLNNSGQNRREIYDVALKLSHDTAGGGVVTSITSYNSVWEVLTGDGYTFDPFGQSKIFFDFNQSQFLTVETVTQELRYTSATNQRVRWIAGMQFFVTDRFISTGNMFDADDSGVRAVYYHPNPQFVIDSFAHGSQISYLADSQEQFAWAVYLDTSTDITDDLELSLNIRYDSDRRENTIKTPQAFLDANLAVGRAAIPATTGDVRTNTWEEIQPQVILRWEASDDLNLYASYGRGFRSGGFNQTGVSTAATLGGFVNVGDLFDAEVADTIEAGFKSRWWDGRVNLNASVWKTWDRNGYYFVFLPSNSTQNLGNIDETELWGFDAELTAALTDHIMFNLGYGFTDSEITEFPDPIVIGAKAPLVPEYTLNVGLQFDYPIATDFNFTARVDYTRIGDTTFVIPVFAPASQVFEAHPVARDPVDLVNVRASIEHGSWKLTAWSRNLFDEEYNTEYSTGGFLFKAQPMTWGIDLTKTF